MLVTLRCALCPAKGVRKMPPIQSRHIGLAMDMCGCPNRCRHCYVGLQSRPNGQMTEDDLRWAAGQFKSYVRDGEEGPFIERLSVMSCTREPDFSDDYERLADLEADLGDGRPTRFELLSIWRLARDEQYAKWAGRVGPDTCQITFFGMRQTQDWFYRRQGAFQDCIVATQRLLEAGMKPRWQLFMTAKILPDLSGLAGLIEQMKIRERVQALGGEFDVFIHPPTLVGEGLTIAHLSATLEDTKLVPVAIVESTKRHFKTDKIWTTEAQTIARIDRAKDGLDVPFGYPRPLLWFSVADDWDVFSNMGTGGPWWRLGNLKTDGIGVIFDNFEQDKILALRENLPSTLRMAAKRYGNPKSQRVVNDISAHWCERHWREVYGPR